jgi:hypothetical protein
MFQHNEGRVSLVCIISSQQGQRQHLDMAVLCTLMVCHCHVALTRPLRSSSRPMTVR